MVKGKIDPNRSAELLGRVHIVGIGAAGMAGLARILLARGISISGCDARAPRAVLGIRALGATCYHGHGVGHLTDIDTVVVSSAVPESTPELVAARARGLQIMSRADLLAALVLGHRSVVVTGTHGKTSTVAMLSVALQHCRADPSFSLGSRINEPGAAAHHGSGEVFVLECGFDDVSSLAAQPEIAIVTGVAGKACEQLEGLVNRIKPHGLLLTCADDPGTVQLGAWARSRGVDSWSYGFDQAADVRIETLDARGARTSIGLVARGQLQGVVDLRVLGRHNALNAAAAYAAGLRLGLPSKAVREGLGGFEGVRRRFEAKGRAGGIQVYDDYAHHPQQIRAALITARQIAGGGRVVVAFQPYLFSATGILASQLGAALGLADEVVVMDIFAGHEQPEPGVTGALVARCVPLDWEHVTYESSWAAVPHLLMARAQRGDVVLTMGAGDVALLGPEVLRVLTDAKALVGA